MKTLRQIADSSAGTLLCLVVALAAIKFGTLATLPETPAIFSDLIADYLFLTWPTSFFGIVAAVILLLEVLAGKSFPLDATAGKLAVLFGFLIAIGALFGAINSPQAWIVKEHIAYYASCGALVLGAKLYIGNDENRCRYLFISAGIAALLVCVAGIEQYFWGFARLRAFVAEEMTRGVFYSEPMLAKVNDSRVFATMTSANVLAGFLLLTAPLGVVAAAKFGERLYPKAYGKLIFGIAAAALTLSVFLLTKTRGAYLALLLTAELALWLAPCRKIWKFASLGVLLIVLVAGAWFIHKQGRGFSSLRERASYVQTAFRVTRQSPLVGGGWGSFSIAQMKYKTTPTDEVPRDPHNILLNMLSQCGILGVVPVALALSMAMIGLYRARRRSIWHTALFFGATAFLLHSMAEINHLVPGEWALFGVLAVAGTTAKEEHRASKGTTFAICSAALLLGIATLLMHFSLLKRDYAYSQYRKALDERNFEEDFRRDAAIAAWQNSPVVYELAGDAAWRRGDRAGAEYFWRQAWEISPTRPSLCRRFAAVETAKGNSIEAQKWRNLAKELFPSDPANR